MFFWSKCLVVSDIPIVSSCVLINIESIYLRILYNKLMINSTMEYIRFTRKNTC